MVKSFHQRASKTPYEEDQPGCMWSVFHLLGLQRRFHSRKMLSDRRQGEEGRSVAGSRYSKLKKRPSSNCQDYEFVNIESSSPVKKESNSPRKKSSYTSNAAPNAEIFSFKQDQKKKVCPVSPCLMRTTSIHHLECNDYVVPDDISASDVDSKGMLHSPDVDNSENGIDHLHQAHENPDESCSSKHHEFCSRISNKECSQHEAFDSMLFVNQELLWPKVEETKLALLKCQKVDSPDPEINAAVNKARKSLDVAKSLNTNMENFFTIVQDPDNLSAHYMQEVRSSTASSVLTRSGSYPRTRHLGNSRNNNESPSIYRQGVIRPKGGPEINVNHGDFQFSSYSSCELKTRNNHSSSQTHYKDIKERLKDITKDNKKENQIIAMDGILDKVPYGHKISHDSGDQVSAFNRYRWKSKSGREWTVMGEKRHAIPHFSRSHSLSDSLERYSNFIESDSKTKSEVHGLERLQLAREGGNSAARMNNFSRSYGRTHSLPEFLADFPIKDDSIEAPHAAFSMQTPAIDPNELFPTICASVPIDQKQEEEVEPSRDACDGSSEHASEINACLSTEDVNQCEDPASLPLQDCRSHPSCGMEIGTEVGSISKSGKLGSLSILDTNFEDVMNPVNILKGKSDFSYPQGFQTLDDSPAGDKITDEKFDISPQASELVEFYAQVDSKDEANFNYILNVLLKTGFYGGSRKQHSLELPLSPMVFKELEGLDPDTEICTLDADIDLDHLLLFDLVNEVLLEMYEVSSPFSPGHLCFDFHKKPLPVGLRCLKEVWSNISRHLVGSSSKLDHLISQELVKKDGWASQKFEIEDEGVEVEEMILNDLLEQFISDMLNLSSNQ